MNHATRPGITMVEVMIATVILAAGLAVLAQLSYVGLENATDARELAIAQVECQTRANELVAGAVPLVATPAEPIPGLRFWSLQVEIAPTRFENLVAVHVRAMKWNAEPKVDGSPAVSQSFELVRWMPKPMPEIESTNPQDASSVDQANASVLFPNTVGANGILSQDANAALFPLTGSEASPLMPPPSDSTDLFDPLSSASPPNMPGPPTLIDESMLPPLPGESDAFQMPGGLDMTPPPLPGPPETGGAP